jgi:hypothetical protein
VKGERDGDTYGYKDDQIWFEGEQDTALMITFKLCRNKHVTASFRHLITVFGLHRRLMASHAAYGLGLKSQVGIHGSGFARSLAWSSDTYSDILQD